MTDMHTMKPLQNFKNTLNGTRRRDNMRSNQRKEDQLDLTCMMMIIIACLIIISHAPLQYYLRLHHILILYVTLRYCPLEPLGETTQEKMLEPDSAVELIVLRMEEDAEKSGLLKPGDTMHNRADIREYWSVCVYMYSCS